MYRRLTKTTDKQNQIQAIKAGIFDLMRQQSTLQQQINGLEQIKQQRLATLDELEKQQVVEQQEQVTSAEVAS